VVQLSKTPGLLELLAWQLSQSSLRSSRLLRSPWFFFVVYVFVWLVPLFFFCLRPLCLLVPCVLLLPFRVYLLLFLSSSSLVIFCVVRPSGFIFFLFSALLCSFVPCVVYPCSLYFFVCGFLLLLFCVYVPLTPRSYLSRAPSFLCVFCSRCSSICFPFFFRVLSFGFSPVFPLVSVFLLPLCFFSLFSLYLSLL